MLTNIGVVYGTSRLLIGTMTGQSQTLGTIRSLWLVKIFQSKHDKVLRYEHHQDTISDTCNSSSFLTRSVLYDSYPTPMLFSLFLRLIPIIRNQIKKNFNHNDKLRVSSRWTWWWVTTHVTDFAQQHTGRYFMKRAHLWGNDTPTT